MADCQRSVNCAGIGQRKVNGSDVRDTLIYGPMNFYKCKRMDNTSSGSGKTQVAGFCLLVGVAVAVVTLSL